MDNNAAQRGGGSIGANEFSQNRSSGAISLKHPSCGQAAGERPFVVRSVNTAGSLKQNYPKYATPKYATRPPMMPATTARETPNAVLVRRKKFISPWAIRLCRLHAPKNGERPPSLQGSWQYYPFRALRNVTVKGQRLSCISGALPSASLMRTNSPCPPKGAILRSPGFQRTAWASFLRSHILDCMDRIATPREIAVDSSKRDQLFRKRGSCTKARA
jgi:hypothetical protein